MVQAPTVNCVNHRRKPKVAACGVCGSALCADCIVHTPVGVKCRKCTGARAAGVFHATDEPPEPSPRRRGEVASGARRRPWAAALVAGGLVVVVVAGVALLSRRSSSGPSTAVDSAASTPDITERQTEFVGAGGQNLAGTFTFPAGTTANGNVPGVLIVPGLGAVDRNSATDATGPDAERDALVATVGGIGIGTPDPLYKDLGEALAKAGVASFRYEKRGTTGSPLRNGQKLSFDDEVADARAALDVLAQRQEIGGAPLAVVGHDTGAVVAMRLASGSPRVKAVVALSMPARPLVDVVADELSRSRGAEVADQWRTAATTLATTGKAPTPDTVPELLRPIFSPGQDAYLASILTFNPLADAGRLAVPLLVVRGGADQNVTAFDNDRLVTVLKSPPDVLLGSAQADHNLSTAGAAGHEHSNTPSAVPVDHRDADARTALAGWVKARLTT